MNLNFHERRFDENIESTLFSNEETELMFDHVEGNLSIYSMDTMTPRPVRNQGLSVNQSMVGERGLRSHRSYMNFQRQRCQRLQNEFVYTYRTDAFESAKRELDK